MYGMLLESVQHFVQRLHGNDTWHRITHVAGVQNVIFTTHGRYSDSIIIRLSSACAEVVRDRTKEEYMCFFGQCFVEYCSHYGYDKIMRISGRHYRDFLRGIDNLHETMRFSYPKMVNPSLIVEKEDMNGCILHYRSRRVGFTHYVIGQLTQFATLYYNVRVDIDVIKEEVSKKGCHVVFRLDFDNTAYKTMQPSHEARTHTEFPPLPQAIFFKIFPFCIVFNKDMLITQTGSSLPLIFKSELAGTPVCDRFLLRRPRMDVFSYENVMSRQSVMFELEVRRYIRSVLKPEASSMSNQDDVVLLKGQMKHVPELNGIAFLCTPLLGNLDDLEDLGLKINDLSMYDFSRDMVLRGWQHSSALEYTIEKQVQKSEQIAENLQQLDAWMSRSEQLLYAMIPQSIAERLRNGEDPINTCQMIDSVTILFCYLVGFTELCTSMPALQCIETINFIFSEFDSVIDDFGIFKVETLGDAVYMAAGGVPDASTDHGVRVAGVALSLRELVKDKIAMEPVVGQTFAVRIGLHTGSVVAGVVGKRTPQYCLFGDTVNTASRMQTYSQPGEIHISETCHDQLVGHGFTTILRGAMDIKGKGSMETYWLVGREGSKTTRPETDTYVQYEQTADQPTRPRVPHDLGRGGFTMETTVKCKEVQRELENLDDDEPEVDLDLPESPINTMVFPKINVEDFKAFMSKKKRRDSGAENNMAEMLLRCPYSGMTLGNNITKTENISGVPENGRTDHDFLLQTEKDDINEDKEEVVADMALLVDDTDGVSIGSTIKFNLKDWPNFVDVGRTDRRRSVSSLMLLDEFRTSIDGATNRLSENYKELHKIRHPHSYPHLESLPSSSFPRLSSSSPPRVVLPDELLTDVREDHQTTATAGSSSTMSSSFVEAARFWHQREQDALRSNHKTEQLAQPKLTSPPDQVLLNGFRHPHGDSQCGDSLVEGIPNCLGLKETENKKDSVSTDSISPGVNSTESRSDVEGIFYMED